MLDIAILYKEELNRLYANTWHQDKYKYYNSQPFWALPDIKDATYEDHDFVSINNRGEIIGAISYAIDRSSNSVWNVEIINFSDDVTFGRDVLRAIRDVFEKFNFHKISFSVVIGNPIEKTYDRLTPRYGGRIVGVERQHVKLYDNKYYDVKRYEILREDYMKTKEHTK